MRLLVDFYEKWFTGPLGYRYRIREVGYAIGPLKHPKTGFNRYPYTLEGFLLLLDEKREWLRHMNLFLSIASYFDLDLNEPLYDSIHYDFDNKEDPKEAIKSALEFANNIRARYNADPIVFISGLHGARVIVPLAKAVGWEDYVLLYKALISPYRYASQLVDNNMLQPNRLDRVPYTWNIKLENKEIKRGFSYIVDLKGKRLRAEDFDWNNYEPLDPSKVTVYTVKADIPKPKTIWIGEKKTSNKQPLPSSIEELAENEAVPPCIRNVIEAMVKSGELDHYQRLALVLYLKWVGFSIDQVVEFFKRYAKDFNERITRYQVEYLYGKRGKREDWLMYSCRKLKELGICLDCGWNRNPVTYTYSRAQVSEEIKQRFYGKAKGQTSSHTAYQINSTTAGLDQATATLSRVQVTEIPDWLQVFLRDTRLRVFDYNDVKQWFERRHGQVPAKKWHSIERELRKLVEQGVLGRKFLVDGQWIDYGSRKIRNPPSKTVKFYVKG